MEKIDNCRNCLFYKPHYAQNDDDEMYMLDTGHCENSRISIMQFKRGFKSNSACRYWQPTKNESSKQSMTELIKNMATRIEQIATHLKIEKS